jgi:hypothetical protein
MEAVTFETLRARIVSPSAECLLGLALIAENKRTPLYDVLTVALCLSPDGDGISAASAQRALESLPTLDLARLEAAVAARAPSGTLRIVIFTDVGLRTVGTVDIDDLIALAYLAIVFGLGSKQLDYLTVVLSHRKKGDGRDLTEPEDVSSMMEARIKGVERVDATTFVVTSTGATVRVFQQHAQTTPNSAQRPLAVYEMVDGDGESATIRAELALANGPLHAHLRATHLSAGQDTVLLGCGPIDVLTAETMCGCAGWTISYSDDAGVNSGRVHTQQQHSNCGAAVLASRGRISDITTGVTRGTGTTDHVLQHVCDAPMLVELAKNTAKVASRPMLLRPAQPSFQAMQSAALCWRILASNIDTLLPGFWAALEVSEPRTVDIAAFGAAVANVPLVPQESAVRSYALAFGLTHLANTLLAAGAPMVRGHIESAHAALAGATMCKCAETEAYGDLPKDVTAMLLVSVPRARVRTASDLLALATLAMAARLSFAMHTARKFGIAGVDVCVAPPTADAVGTGLSIATPLTFS